VPVRTVRQTSDVLPVTPWLCRTSTARPPLRRGVVKTWWSGDSRHLAVAMACSLALGACGRPIPVPASAPQPDEAFVRVPYPPPPARVEQLPARPKQESVWLDGQWLWDGERWTWSPGGWVAPPRGGVFARWELRLNADGRLEFAQATWRDAAGHELPPASVLAEAIGQGASPGPSARCQ
jgi:hypothetical protein